MSDPIREAREQLLRVGLRGEYRPSSTVPELIVRSWRRSIGNAVESRRPPQRFREIDPDTFLSKAAAPVLDRWQHQLTDTATTLFLSDRAGSIVARRASDSSEMRRLDELHAAEGFDYSEDSVGTNGLGTSMVEKRPVFVQGSQHYSDALATLACAAAPVLSPSGLVIGSVSLGGSVEAASPIMLSLTREISQQIEDRLRATSRPQDLALAMSFLRFTNSQRPTVVMDQESILANTPGLPYVNVASHVMLWEMLSFHRWSAGGQIRFKMEGTTIEIVARQVLDGPRAHYVVHFEDLAEDLALATSGAAPKAPGAQLVSNHPPTARSGIAVVEGPPGSGRATRAVEILSGTGTPSGWQSVAASPAATIPWHSLAANLRAGTSVVLRRLEVLPAGEGQRLWELVEEHRRSLARGNAAASLILTSSPDAHTSIRAALEGIETIVQTRGLAQTPERIPGLVKQILDDLDAESRHSISPAALQTLVRWTWPGNLSELRALIADLVGRVNASVIERRHLPKQMQEAPPRKQLTMLESAERDAILRALDAARGNKSEAADLLGMGRTTLYRRLRQLGLDAGEASI